MRGQDLLHNVFPNLLVIQTFSKSRALAGMRIGLALGDAQLIEGLERVKDSFNSYPLDRLAIVAATAAIEDGVYFRATCQQGIDPQEQVCKWLNNEGFPHSTILSSQVGMSKPGFHWRRAWPVKTRLAWVLR